MLLLLVITTDEIAEVIALGAITVARWLLCSAFVAVFSCLMLLLLLFFPPLLFSLLRLANVLAKPVVYPIC